MPDGSAFVFSTYLGARGTDDGLAIALGSGDSVLVAGHTASSDFPTVNALQPEYRGGSDAFLARLAANGSALSYSTYFGGSRGESGMAVAVGAGGEMYLAGHTFSSDFPTFNAFQPRIGGDADAFITKLNAAGTAILYSTYLGGRDTDGVRDLAVVYSETST